MQSLVAHAFHQLYTNTQQMHFLHFLYSCGGNLNALHIAFARGKNALLDSEDQFPARCGQLRRIGPGAIATAFASQCTAQVSTTSICRSTDAESYGFSQVNDVLYVPMDSSSN